MEYESFCGICDGRLDDSYTTLSGDDLQTLIAVSIFKDDGKDQHWNGKSIIHVHKECHNKYNSRKRALPSDEPSSSVSKDSTDQSYQSDVEETINYKSVCLYCIKTCKLSNKNTRKVVNDNVKNEIINIANKRKDDFGDQVKQRIEKIDSLTALGAQYHIACYKKFRDFPSESSFQAQNVAESFEKACNFIETGMKIFYTISEINVAMGDYQLDRRTLLNKLKNKYGNDICISTYRGSGTRIFYKSYKLADVINQWYGNDGSFSESAKHLILDVAADILRKDIESCEFDKDHYPPSMKFLSGIEDDIPLNLLNFLENVLDLNIKDEAKTKKRLKRNGIAHSIVSALSPRKFCSHLQLALGIYIHQRTGSKLILEVLSKFGYCVSYDMVQQYENSVAASPSNLVIDDDTYVQYVFDNTDHNTVTLTGQQTFHCLGGIAIYTPRDGVNVKGSVPKLRDIKAATIASRHEVKTIPYVPEISTGFDEIKYTDTDKLGVGEPPKMPFPYVSFLLAKFSKIEKVPSWGGFMSDLTQDMDVADSEVIFLPFIKLPPSDLTTINTALHVALSEAKKLNQMNVCCTFDQPLYHKARLIVANCPKELGNILVVLGGFHLLMAFLGTIGHIMKGSGLEDLWKTVYASNSVKHMMEGSFYSRAVRAHILTFTAIGLHIIALLSPDDKIEYEREIRKFFKSWATNPPSLGEVLVDKNIQKITKELIQKVQDLKKKGPTAQLWVIYFECVCIFLQFIEADRIGNWKLHLQTIRQMLPYFHAAGRFAYCKSAQLYLQDFAFVDVTMQSETELKCYTDHGYFTVRTGEEVFTGTPTDQIIERSLNRLFGINLKHGRGVTPSVVAKFFANMPSTINIMCGLESLSGVNIVNSEQHKDLRKSRVLVDDEHLRRFLYWLEEHQPFRERTSIMSLSTGICGGPDINCHLAYELGRKGMQSMIGKTVKELSLSKINKVKNLESAKSGAHINTDVASVDPLLLFQRISALFDGDANKTKEALQFELSPFPLSIFDEDGFMRKNVKSELFKIFKTMPRSFQCSNFLYVIDGGFLLRKVIWANHVTFKYICDMYSTYVLKHFGKNAIVVFDGYDKTTISIKSYERYRRKEKNMAPDIEVDKDKLIQDMSQTQFLSNVANKLKFVNLLSEHMKSHSIKVKVAREDADVEIVRTAIEEAESATNTQPVAIVGNDIDLLVLLIGLTPKNTTIYMRKSNRGAKEDDIYSTSWNETYKNCMLFAHAFAGCDSTSAFYGKGKKKILNCALKDTELNECVPIFYHKESSIEQLIEVAEKFVLKIYKIKNCTNYEDLRYRHYISSAVRGKKNAVRLAQLPPSRPVLHEHAKRTYWQVQQWLGNELPPELWGWKQTELMMIPIMNTENAAPELLLSKIFCSCTSDCQSSRCSCKKSGFSCSKHCSNCNGTSCNNPASAPIFSTEEIFGDENYDQASGNQDNIHSDSDDERFFKVGEVDNKHDDNDCE